MSFTQQTGTMLAIEDKQSDTDRLDEALVVSSCSRLRLPKGKEEDTVFPVNGFPVDTNSTSLLLPRDRLTHETSPYRFYAKWKRASSLPILMSPTTV
ncbi:hypothetical protein BO85DRAFT_484833 [Aspergillus piperis CBS 112811]|uniref:Uncharacterized protein n=1 Tax=Aspergillus piperis CBS 112811 TaxID=1448313 RepID=A0A8G1R851_9EURO|nr:hypothetical protein BO85DRAFT_484833 [Aspergillus piperis CBS 112811]RAH61083.1 hypothetical protein BO85DRAFT_484833 [Aspergillus piperis CBS 112811]